MDRELQSLVSRFQQLQRQEVPKKITDRNVIEIIGILQKKKLVELIYTCDGKEFLTWAQLKREILDELQVHGGRFEHG